MRLAAYNLENLFDRAKAMNLDSWEEGKPILAAFAKLNSLLGEITYSAADKRKIVELIIELGLEKSDKGPFVVLRRNHGGLVKRPRAGGLEITPTAAQIGWVRLNCSTSRSTKTPCGIRPAFLPILKPMSSG
jgi:hypothetical protein